GHGRVQGDAGLRLGVCGPRGPGRARAPSAGVRARALHDPRSDPRARRGGSRPLMQARTVRRIALELPDAEERETWETATFRVRNKIFVMFAERERDRWIKSTRDEQKALTAMDPDTFFVPPYVGPSGWGGVRIRTVDPDELGELVPAAWMAAAR